MRKKVRTKQGVTKQWLNQVSVAEKVADNRRQGAGRPGGVGGTCPLKWLWGLARLDKMYGVQRPFG